jgi:predicted alpha/beta-fold hydrolase
MRRKAAAFPNDYALEALRSVRTVRSFDEAYTAPHHGFADASDYYQRASAIRVIDRIRVPALIMTAEDDPFVPVEPFREAAVRGNPNVTVVVTKHGGHCAYLEHAANGSDGYWAEREVVRFVNQAIGDLRSDYRSKHRSSIIDESIGVSMRDDR